MQSKPKDISYGVWPYLFLITRAVFGYYLLKYKPMCGIIGYLKTLTPKRNVWDVMVHGLSILQNRGYDSAGIALANLSEEMYTFKRASTPSLSAIKILKDHSPVLEGNIWGGIGHTRWATHGPCTDENSHPHYDSKKDFVIVHNGIIENYLEWKTFLMAKGHTFQSQTDSEVIAVLWSYYTSTNEGDALKGFDQTVKSLGGTWGVVGMHRYSPGRLFCARHGSPLLIGLSETCDEAFVTSEPSGFGPYAKRYICLKPNDVATLDVRKDKVHLGVIDPLAYEARMAETSFEPSPDPYRYWTEKEIASQAQVVSLAMGNGGRLNGSMVRLGGISDYRDTLLAHDHLIFLGCGTSLHAAKAMTSVYRKISGFTTVQAFDGAAFDLSFLPPSSSKTLLVFISQSGETKDLARCIDLAKEKSLCMVGIVNAVDSLIAREVMCGIYLNAGREVGVASTKAFTAQVTVLSLLAAWFSQERKIATSYRERLVENLRALPYDVEAVLKVDINPLVTALHKCSSVFCLGKDQAHYGALEASLKLKEMTYIHAEGFEGSSLKHGPFALLTPETPVFLFMDVRGKVDPKMVNAFKEIEARHAPLVSLSSGKDATVRLPSNEDFGFLLALIPIQRAAFTLSLSKGINPDYPRNLAKVVTVE